MLLWAREGDTASQYSSGVRTAVQMQYLLTYLLTGAGSALVELSAGVGY